MACRGRGPEGHEIDLVDVEIPGLELGRSGIGGICDRPANLEIHGPLLGAQTVEEGSRRDKDRGRLDMTGQREVPGDLKVLLLLETVNRRLGTVGHTALQGGTGLAPRNLLRGRAHLLEHALAERAAGDAGLQPVEVIGFRDCLLGVDDMTEPVFLDADHAHPADLLDPRPDGPFKSGRHRTLDMRRVREQPRQVEDAELPVELHDARATLIISSDPAWIFATSAFSLPG